MADLSPPATEQIALKQRRSTLILVVLNNVLLFFGFRLWQSLFNNFAVQELGVRAAQIGLIQSIRELPGLLGFSVGMLALLLTEIRIAGLSVILMGVGILLTGSASSLTSLVASTLVMSVGFHYFISCNSAAVLLLSDKDEAPQTLGRLNSLNALAALASAGVIFLTLDTLGFRTLFYATGALVVIGGLALLPWGRQPARPPRPKKRIHIRQRYWLYYTLEFLMGSRRHIFSTFAIFLLVQEHQVAAQNITILLVINSLIGAFLYQQFGKIIARLGERRVLSLNFLFLTLVFLGYAYIPELAILYLLFVADQILFGFSIALKSYFQKIAVHPREITPNLSLGQTINHLSAVIIPLVGGTVWEVVGARYTFLIGVGIVILSLILTQWMHVEHAKCSEL